MPTGILGDAAMLGPRGARARGVLEQHEVARCLGELELLGGFLEWQRLDATGAGGRAAVSGAMRPRR